MRVVWWAGGWDEKEKDGATTTGAAWYLCDRLHQLDRIWTGMRLLSENGSIYYIHTIQFRCLCCCCCCCCEIGEPPRKKLRNIIPFILVYHVSPSCRKTLYISVNYDIESFCRFILLLVLFFSKHFFFVSFFFNCNCLF